MDSLKDHAIPIISFLIAINAAGFGWIWKTIDDILKSHSEKLDKNIELHMACQREISEKYATNRSVQDICNTLNTICDRLNNIPLIYRSKEDANKDWRALEGRLSEMYAIIKAQGDGQVERHREIWDKLNRVVDEFRASRNIIIDRQTAIEQRVFTGKELVESNKALRVAQENLG